MREQTTTTLNQTTAKDLKRGDVIEHSIEEKFMDGSMTVALRVMKVMRHPSNLNKVRISGIVPAYKTMPSFRCSLRMDADQFVRMVS